MKKARMNISHFRYTLFNLKIFGEIITTKKKMQALFHPQTMIILLSSIFSLN